MRHCHYKQSLVLSHANDLRDYYNFDYNTSIQEYNNQTEIQRELVKTMTCLPKPPENVLKLSNALHEKCQNTEILWFIFSRFRTEYGDLLCEFLWSFRIRENMDQEIK